MMRKNHNVTAEPLFYWVRVLWLTNKKKHWKRVNLSWTKCQGNRYASCTVSFEIKIFSIQVSLFVVLRCQLSKNDFQIYLKAQNCEWRIRSTVILIWPIARPSFKHVMEKVMLQFISNSLSRHIYFMHCYQWDFAIT